METLTRKEVADHLKVTERTVVRMEADGRLRSRKRDAGRHRVIFDVDTLNEDLAKMGCKLWAGATTD
jgi:excisionase family DNA binding protein